MISEIKHAFRQNSLKKALRCLLSMLHPRLLGNIVYFKNHHCFIDYKNPKTLDQKLLILRGETYYKNELISRCADKYAVRDYIVSKDESFQNHLVDLLGIYDRAEDIEWDALPEKFVIKCNHGSGYNIIVRDKACLNIQSTVHQLNIWMNENYGIVSTEHQYKCINPKITIEKFLEGEGGNPPVDYKFFASRGEVICCLLVTGRGKKQERIYVDSEFKDLGLVDEYTGEDYSKLRPSSYKKMLEVSRKLSEDFPFVRVDLYDVNGSVYFGELTFTPHGCHHDYLSNDAQVWIGSRIQL